MNNEYIIINKTEVLKRIEELEAELRFYYNTPDAENSDKYIIQIQQSIQVLQEITNMSTPLIPEIEKALYSKGAWYEYEIQDYISNLKLDI